MRLLLPGQQDRLIAAKGLSSVKLVARAVRQNRGVQYLSQFKFVLDSKSGTVYVLVNDEEDAKLMAGRSFQVQGQIMSFYRVLSVTVRPAQEDIYQTVDVDRLWPESIAEVMGSTSKT